MTTRISELTANEVLASLLRRLTYKEIIKIMSYLDAEFKYSAYINARHKSVECLAPEEREFNDEMTKFLEREHDDLQN